MRCSGRTCGNPTHAIALRTAIAERSDLEVGVQRVSTSVMDGLISGEHYNESAFPAF